MNNTPETDAQGFGDGRHPWVGTDFARKLKRERDEARTELEMWRDGNILHEIHRDELEKVERERDDAREAWYEMQSSFERSRDEVEKLIRERDEAREECKFLWDERDQARGELSLKQQTLTIAEGTLADLRKELQEWQTLRIWGGTPEHIDDFVKGQQTRIHHAQDIERTCELYEQERDEAREELLAFKRERVHMTDLFVLLNEWLDVSKISVVCGMRFTLQLCARELSELILKNIHLNGGAITFSKQKETK